jgi:chromosome partitioning protein
MKVIGLLNQKGGVDKTTLALALDECFAQMGYRVLLVDVDPQGSALDWAAARQDDPLFSVVGLPRSSVHKEIASIGAGYDIATQHGKVRRSPSNTGYTADLKSTNFFRGKRSMAESVVMGN